MSFGRMWKRAVPHERSEVEWCFALLRDAGVSVVAIGASLAAGSGHDDRGIALYGKSDHGGKATRRSTAEAHPPPPRECAAKCKPIHVNSVQKDDMDIRHVGAR